MSTEALLKIIKDRHRNQPTFIQAVTESLESIENYMQEINASPADYHLLERLLVPERIVVFRVTWQDDNGDLQYNTGYRVQYNSALGPYKGGLRFDPSVNEDVLKFLGFEQIFKNSLTGLPLGAGKGGGDFDPKGKSDNEIRSFCRAFMTELHRHVGLETDVPAGDIGVGGREIGYLYGMYKQITNRSEGVLTGKGVDFGGSCGRTEATGYGAVYFAAAMLETRNESLASKAAVVSGSGNVAAYAARKLIDEGAKVLTLSDRRGYLEKSDGFTKADIKVIEEGKRAHQPLSDISVTGAKYHKGKLWQAVKADLYFPCATQNEINGPDAKAIVASGAMLVAEGANMPSDSEALKVFRDSDILFGPGKAANAGGVAVSGLEMAQNAGHHPWKYEDIDAELREIMINIHAICVQYGQKEDGSIDYVNGANIGGFVRVFRAMKALGW